MRGLRRRDGDCVAILLYHRVAERRGGDPLGLNVSATRLEEQLAVAAKRFRIVSLTELTDAAEGERRGATLAITFDDGYTGVLDHAAPIVQRFGLPTTAFVPSGFVGSHREFWWEELEGILLHDRPLPPSLELDVAGTTLRWSANDSQRRLLHRRVSVRERLYYQVARLLARTSHDERVRVLAELSSWAGIETPRRRERMPLRVDELRVLAESGAVEIGAHTVSHPVLAALEPSAQAREIVESKRTLEEIIGRPVASFAYPYGGEADYSRESVDAVRAAGFELACANVQAPVGPESNRFELPRFIVRDWDGATFMRRLDRLFTHRRHRTVLPFGRGAA